jgi:hypothetical protein
MTFKHTLIAASTALALLTAGTLTLSAVATTDTASTPSAPINTGVPTATLTLAQNAANQLADSQNLAHAMTNSCLQSSMADSTLYSFTFSNPAWAGKTISVSVYGNGSIAETAQLNAAK